MIGNSELGVYVSVKCSKLVHKRVLKEDGVIECKYDLGIEVKNLRIIRRLKWLGIRHLRIGVTKRDLKNRRL